MSDRIAAWAWTWKPSTVDRVREAARKHGEDAAALLEVLRAYAWFSDGTDGTNAYPGLRTLAEGTAIGRNRIPRLRDALVAEGLLIATGQRVGRGGTEVFELPLDEPTGATLSGASSPDDVTGTAQAGASPDSNWHRTGTELAPPMCGALPRTSTKTALTPNAPVARLAPTPTREAAPNTPRGTPERTTIPQAEKDRVLTGAFLRRIDGGRR